MSLFCKSAQTIEKQNFYKEKREFSLAKIHKMLSEKIMSLYKLLYKNLHVIYLIIAAPFCIISCFIVPPLLGSDEWAHFARAVEISAGKITGEQGKKGENGGSSVIPDSILTFMLHPSFSPEYFSSDSKIKIEKSSRVDLRHLEWSKNEVVTGNPFVAYPPTSYIPASIALFISRVAGVHIISSFYVGRFSTAVASLILAAITISLLDRGKWFAFLFLSTPAVLYLFGSYAQDAMLICYVAIAIALFDYSHRNKFSRKKSDIILGICAVFFSAVIAARPPYLPLALLLPIYLIWFKKETRLGLIAFAIIIAYPLIWALIAAPLVHHNQFPGIDEYAQAKFILGHPLRFISALLNSSIQWRAVFGLAGTTSLPLPSYAYKLYILVFAALAINESFAHQNLRPVTFRVLSVVAFVGCSVLLMTVSYLCWTPLESEAAYPLAGRYLLPLTFLFIFIPGFKTPRIKKSLYWIPLSISIISIFVIVLVNLNGVLSLMHGYLFIR